MSLAPNIDDVQYANLDCVCITEACIRSHIHDNVVAVVGFNLVLKDRVDLIHGGVCVYIRDTSTLLSWKIKKIHLLKRFG